ncbi:hypothetical protein [Xanthomonas citri]|uniref:hypothetical protein n=1 Tax=Xanthomonas citri TaxID=346 RepID=UPI001F3CD9F6|nr:hypothetical protein [Xanthomonas citri]
MFFNYRKIMPINRSDSSSSVVREWSSLSDVHDERLQEIVGSVVPDPVAVSRKTFEAMGLASRVLKKTGYKTFPDGPGNQETAICMSGGRSWTRMKLARDMVESGHCSDEFDEVRKIKEFGGGNCGEHRRMSAAELRSMPRKMPVIQVKHAERDHNYVVIGDWRDRAVGDHAVVVDPWPMLKKVHTYGERLESSAPIPLMSYAPGPAEPNPLLAQALAAEPADNSKMERFTKMRTKHPAGPQAASALVRALRENHSCADRAASTKNLYQAYVDPDGNISAFNDAPAGYVTDYLNAKDFLKKI